LGVNALALLTVSDHFITGEVTSAEKRQTIFTNRIEVASYTIVKLYR
jgi:purine-nucleoside phosphorylase